MKRILTTFATALVLATASGCGPNVTREAGAEPAAEANAKAGVNVAASEAAGPNTYKVASVGLTVTAPDGWYVADSAVMKKLMDAGTDVMTADMDPMMKAAAGASVQRTATLFTFSRTPPGAPVESGAMVMGITEDISMLPGIKRGSDYFFHARRLMAQTSMQSEIGEEYGERKIGGQDFDRMDVKAFMPNGVVYQRMFATRHDDVIFVIVQAYSNEADLPELDAVLDSVKLDW